jgi:hypothetical protein
MDRRERTVWRGKGNWVTPVEIYNPESTVEDEELDEAILV